MVKRQGREASHLANGISGVGLKEDKAAGYVQLKQIFRHVERPYVERVTHSIPETLNL
jgi:hypothetical protein